jgi:hypothetical protein
MLSSVLNSDRATDGANWRMPNLTSLTFMVEHYSHPDLWSSTAAAEE